MYKIWPMGCKKVKDEDQLEKLFKDDNYVAQTKIDGVRCIMHVDSHGKVRFTTRGASVDDPTRPIEITHRLTHLTGDLCAENDSIFDGELYCPKYTSAEVSGMITHRSTVPVDPEITLNIFDCLRFHGNTLVSKPWSQRVYFLYGQAQYLKIHGFKVVPYVATEQDKRELLYKELAEGREGVVFKNINATYKLDADRCLKPTGVWYKAKKHDTLDVIITGSEPPEQFYRDPKTNSVDTNRETKPWTKGWFGSITFSFKLNGKVYNGACSGITDEMKEVMSDGCHNIKDEYFGRWVEVEYMEKTADGNLRHPRFVRLREEIEK